jgi:hypothetical protein
VSREPDEWSGTPEQARVRELLRAAAAPPPALPDEVRASLDDVLEDLVASREGRADQPHSAAAVTSLSRRRRRWPQALAAAAAVSAIALGVGNAVGPGTTSQEAGSAPAAEEHAGAGAAQDDADEYGAAAEEDREAASEDLDSQALSGRGRRASHRLRSERLRADVQRVEDFALAVPVSEARPEGCVKPPTSSGDAWLRVVLDGTSGVLVLRRPEDGTRLAEVFGCGEPGTPVAATTVSAR